ncbi:BREX-1 system adenine-specific DNA-methyltransferase PglX [Marinobacter sp. ES-1]|uniref:BREX-1 system adenine-specific DNA-methyltransferase PglX n=1 Tax=Marinobacter sp. ES-1 TaxID=1396858 RepID=UPI002227AD0B|nr:BREX-1 system adenine-specific DNA-methyltransferase PglX [Marinobacter sp. ES-1]
MNNKQAIDTSQPIENYLFQASAADFKKIPGKPIAYWASPSFCNSFFSGEKIGSAAKKGLSCSGTDIFYRYHWEVKKDSFSKNGGEVWFPITKGGPFRKWYGNNDNLIYWADNGDSIRSRTDKSGNPLAVIRNEKAYFKTCVSWNDVSTGRLSSRFTPEGSIPTDSGPAIYSSDKLYGILAFLNSCVSKPFTDVLCPTIHFGVGQISEFPLLLNPEISYRDVTEALINQSKLDWDSYETSWDFTGLPLLNPDYLQPTLKATYQKLRADWQEMTLEIQQLEEENNRIFIESYGLHDELTPNVPLDEITLTCNPHYRYGSNKSEEELEALLLADTMRDLVSYAVGCMFGRYALDKPGLILANQGETIEDYLERVPEPSFPADDDNVIPMLDGDWFTDDITERFREFLRIAFGEEHYDENLRFVEQALGKDIRKYFLKDFYNDHVRRYKKRPIYWLFSSPKGSFNTLIYMHRYQPHTVGTVLEYLRDFKDEKLKARKNHLEAVSISAGASQGDKTKALKEIEKINKILAELDDYERDVLYPLATEQVEIDLDDGVKANYPKFGDALKKITGLSQ